MNNFVSSLGNILCAYRSFGTTIHEVGYNPPPLHLLVSQIEDNDWNDEQKADIHELLAED